VSFKVSKRTDEKLLKVSKSQKHSAQKVNHSASPSETPTVLQLNFKVDKSSAARSLSKAYAMTQKRLHGDN
jgi:hypothetical protein